MINSTLEHSASHPLNSRQQHDAGSFHTTVPLSRNKGGGKQGEGVSLSDLNEDCLLQIFNTADVNSFLYLKTTCRMFLKNKLFKMSFVQALEVILKSTCVQKNNVESNTKLKNLKIILDDLNLNLRNYKRYKHFMFDLIIKAIEFQHHNLFNLILDFGFDPSTKEQALLKKACLVGDIYFVRVLLEDSRVIPPPCTIQIACNLSNIKLVKLLIQDNRINLLDHNPLSICNNHISLVKELNFLPNINANNAFTLSSVFGRDDILKFLILDERVDPSIGENYALRKSIESENDYLQMLLLSDVRVSQLRGN